MAQYSDEQDDTTPGRRRPAIDFSKPAKSPEQALASLQYTCSRMERCTSDVRRSMIRWRMAQENFGPIIDSLIQDKFIDEQRYAAAYVRDKLSGGGWGRLKIEQGLRAKQIPRQVIEEALGQIEPEGQQQKLEDMLRRRYLRESPKATNMYALRTKLMRWAMGRGYDYESILGAMRRITSEDMDD